MPIALGKSRLPNDLRLYAVGDVHGCLAQLNELVASIETDRRDNPVKKSGIIFLGDYLDRGPESKGVISRLIHLMAQDKSVLCLCGNHDLALQKFLDFPDEYGNTYFSNGGGTTLRSYGLSVPKGPTSSKNRQKIASYARMLVPKNHLDFLALLPHGAMFGDYFFCHAGIRPGTPIDDQKPEDLIWIRKGFIDHTKRLEKVVVHGHTPVADVEFHNNRIALDTKCYATGRLSCLVLEGREQRLLQT